MKTLTFKTKRFIVDYVKNAYFDNDLFKTTDHIVENVIENLIDNKLIPLKPYERIDNDCLIAFIQQVVRKYLTNEK